MAISRPLPKALLKKMFLKVLHEHKPGGRYEMHGHSTGGIITKIPEFFRLDDPLSEEEIAEALRAIYELERDDFIMQDPKQTHSSEFMILTLKAKKVVGDSIKDMKLPAIDIDQILSRDDLRERVHDDFLVSDFEIAIFKAFRLLEEVVRNKAGLPPEVIGAKLMTDAFKPGGILKHPTALTEGEIEGFHYLMRGAVMWFKNPSSHRTVGYEDDIQAAHVLGFANLLLDLAEQCKPI